MADKSFGVKKLDLIGASGTPTIQSPNNLNLNAINVAISTDLSIGGEIKSNVIVGSSYSIGVGTPNPSSKLYVVGDAYFSDVVKANNFIGNLTGTATTASFASTAFSISGTASTASYATTSGYLADANNILTGTINSSRLTGQYNINIAGGSYESVFSDNLRNAANIITGTINSDRLSGNYNINVTGTATTSTNVSGGIATITSLFVSGVSTLGNVRISSGIVTASTGVVTYYGDGRNLTNIIAAGVGITIFRNGSLIGIGSIINFQDDFGVSILSGYATVTVDKNAVNYFKTSATGIHTLVNVGIGTTNATSKLTVDGDLKVTGSIIADLGVNQTNEVKLVPTPVDTTTFPLFVSSSTTGIGTSVFTDSTIYWDTTNDILNLPTLQPSSGINLNDDKYVKFGTSNDVSVFYNGVENALEVQLESSATKYAITDGGIYRHIFTKDGKVGIGTTVTPTVSLVVNGSSNINGISTIANVKITPIGTGATIGNSNAGIVTYYGDGQYLQNINVGVSSAVGSDGQIQYNNGGITLGGASQFYYDDITNRVGIGTSLPTQDLHVEGNIYVSGIITAAQPISGTIENASKLALTSTPVDSVTYPLFAADSTGNQSVFSDSDITWDATNNRFTSPIIRATTQLELLDADELHFGSAPDVKVSYAGTENVLNFRMESTVNYISFNDGATERTKLFKSGGADFTTGIVTATDFNSASDERLKTNIQTIEDPLEKVLQIRGVNFEWKENNRKSCGVIAQEVQSIFPELVIDGEIKTVNYNGLIGVLIESIKELKSEIEELKEKINN